MAVKSDKNDPPSGPEVTVPAEDVRRKSEGPQGGATGSGGGTPVTRTPAENAKAENAKARTPSPGDDDRG